MKSRQYLVSAVFLVVGIGVGAAVSLWWRPESSAVSQTPHTASAPSQRHILYWANPMNPAIHANHPMKDNMGMKYIPVYSQPTSTSHSATPALAVDSRMVQTLGVRLVPVQKRRIGRAIHTVGTVAIDENRLYAINPHFSGWVEQLAVKAVGDPVSRGQEIAEVYSPELYSAEQEYLVAQNTAGISLGKSLGSAAKTRLQLLGLSTAQIRQLRQTAVAEKEIPVYAPISGVVDSLQVRQGGYISPQSNLMQVANLQRVWVNVALYGYQLPWVQIGDEVTLELPAYPGKTWKGRVSFLYPTVNSQSRTVTARLSFPNPDNVLRPGMYADATLLAQAQRVLAVPSSAVLHAQEGDFVMLHEPGGHFRPAQVQVGPEAGGWTAIPRGLQAGERVVDNAQFLLYSESQFQSVQARMLGSDTASAASTVPATHAKATARAVSPAAASMKGMAMGGNAHD
ncbi:efflux RND transporter periplasmic adaptor subunit [Acidithiobacillus sp. IBUN Pt1247-S3]|uniref:efflux RND transporter periplasmic adaptor subunit n=1 Tax=Acidithiobacillus sp. IBUN Pt1247-S3 TaxID=3166642 RepID=UPI0034E4B736